MQAYVYLLTNDRLNVIYTESNNDLKQRVYQHKNRFLPGFTKKYNVHRLVYFERHPSIEKAALRERQIKGYKRSKKDALVVQINPTWCDLYEDLK
jgi:putative endonuclease